MNTHYSLFILTTSTYRTSARVGGSAGNTRSNERSAVIPLRSQWRKNESGPRTHEFESYEGQVLEYCRGGSVMQTVRSGKASPRRSLMTRDLRDQQASAGRIEARRKEHEQRPCGPRESDGHEVSKQAGEAGSEQLREPGIRFG